MRHLGAEPNEVIRLLKSRWIPAFAGMTSDFLQARGPSDESNGLFEEIVPSPQPGFSPHAAFSAPASTMRTRSAMMSVSWKSFGV